MFKFVQGLVILKISVLFAREIHLEELEKVETATSTSVHHLKVKTGSNGCTFCEISFRVIGPEVQKFRLNNHVIYLFSTNGQI